jgi:competence transcription factor ComK
MEITLSRVYDNDVPEHKPVFKKKKVYLDTIESIEESINNINYTKITLANGDEFQINESYASIENRIETLLEDKKDEERNRHLGI